MRSMTNEKKNVLDVSNVSVSYDGKRNVIEDISITIKAGTCFGLIGLNGVGKTTFIKTILGLRQPDDGAVLICGVNTAKIETNRNVSYLPERFDPPWFLNGYEFVKFSLDLYGKKFCENKVNALADKLSLDQTFLSKRTQSYSKGMRQKLGLIAAILAECPLLVLDEPMSGLDPMARRQVKQILIDCREKGQSILICSHILADMKEFCDKIAIIDSQRIVYQGGVQKLLDETSGENLEDAFMRKIGRV